MILSGNNLSRIPNWVVDLPNLEKLFLGDNKIKYLLDLSKSKSLKELYLNNNPLKKYPSFLINMNLMKLLVDDQDKRKTNEEENTGLFENLFE